MNKIHLSYEKNIDPEPVFDKIRYLLHVEEFTDDKGWIDGVISFYDIAKAIKLLTDLVEKLYEEKKDGNNK